MPSSGVIKSDALSNEKGKRDQYTYTLGFVSNLPSYLNGNNIIDLGSMYDRMLEAFSYYTLQRLDKRHIAVENVDSLNGKELNDRMRYLGIPYVYTENDKSKKRRTIDWWSKNRGNGDEGTVKSSIYNFIGSGAFYDYDTEEGNNDFGKTSRIEFTLPQSGSTWGDHPSSSNFNYAEFPLTAEGTWTSFDDLGKAELDIKIYYRVLSDYYYYKQNTKKAELYYLINKVKPLGNLFTITDIYDGTLNATTSTGNPNLVLWYEFDRGVSDKTGTYTPTSSNTSIQSGLGSNTLRFNGSSSHVTLTSADVMHTEGAIFGWLYVDEQNGDQYMFSFDNNDDYIFHQSGTGIVYKIEGGTEETFSGTANYGTAVWNFVGMQWDGSNFEYIYNDSIVASGTDSGLTTTSATLVMGKRHDDTNYLQGNIRNFRIYDRKLEQTEWLELYSGISQFV